MGGQDVPGRKVWKEVPYLRNCLQSPLLERPSPNQLHHTVSRLWPMSSSPHLVSDSLDGDRWGSPSTKWGRIHYTAWRKVTRVPRNQTGLWYCSSPGKVQCGTMAVLMGSPHRIWAPKDETLGHKHCEPYRRLLPWQGFLNAQWEGGNSEKNCLGIPLSHGAEKGVIFICYFGGQKTKRDRKWTHRGILARDDTSNTWYFRAIPIVKPEPRLKSRLCTEGKAVMAAWNVSSPKSNSLQWQSHFQKVWVSSCVPRSPPPQWECWCSEILRWNSIWLGLRRASVQTEMQK